MSREIILTYDEDELNNKNTNDKNEKKLTKKDKVKKYSIFAFIIILLSVLLVTAKEWLYSYFGNLTFNEIVFHIKVPLEGTNSGIVKDGITSNLFTVIVLTIIIYGIVTALFEKTKRVIIASLVIIFISIIYCVCSTDMMDFIISQFQTSTLIEEEYIDPSNVDITFPEKKRNLIYIYLESMETSHFSEELGGRMYYNMTPELSELAEKNTSFSTNKLYSGAIPLSGTTWTTGAMVAQMGGIPLKTDFADYNDFSGYDFLPGATMLGDILEENGYTQELLIGSDVQFGGRKDLFEEHGDYKVFDLNTAIERGYMTEEDKVWWGFDDKDLFSYAKDELLHLANENEPFNFTMLTADTHFPGGYVCDLCEELNPKRYHYENVISCSSKQVAEFVEWVQMQSFYPNTTIILCGDHLTMDQDLEKVHDFDPDYERGVINIFINSVPQIDKKNTKNKAFSTFDLFPTTLGAMGVKISGNRLGLGVNLFSREETLLQKYNINYLNKELDKKSKFYNSKFVYGK